MVAQTNEKLNKYTALTLAANSGNMDMASMSANRKEKEALKKQIEEMIASQTPLKWINRVIMWVADKMPSCADALYEHTPEAKSLDPAEVVKQAMALPKNAAVVKVRKERTTLLQTYRGPKV